MERGSDDSAQYFAKMYTVGLILIANVQGFIERGEGGDLGSPPPPSRIPNINSYCKRKIPVVDSQKSKKYFLSLECVIIEASHTHLSAHV